MTKILRNRKDLIMLTLCALFFFFGVITVQAMTYYVAPGGSDLNDGLSAGSPFLTIQKGIDSVTAPGDIITVANGTYTDTDGNGVVGYIRSPNPNGASGNPITLKSTNPLGAKITVPSKDGQGNHGIYIDRAYWIVEGFDISGGRSTALGTGHSGITLNGSNGSVVRKNALHHVARTVCSNSVIGNAGIYTSPAASNTIIEDNQIYSNGRLNNGESGCSTIINGNDHGIYLEGSTGLTIQHNIFYDDNRGWPIHVYNGYGLTASNINIYNNTFADKSPLGATGPAGHVLIARGVRNITIKNNISYDPYSGMVRCSTPTAATNVLVDHNLTSSAIKSSEPCPAGVTFSNNLVSTSPGFVRAGTRDYRLVSSSAAIDAGTDVGLPFSGAAPDIGAYESNGGFVAPAAPTNLRVQ